MSVEIMAISIWENLITAMTTIAVITDCSDSYQMTGKNIDKTVHNYEMQISNYNMQIFRPFISCTTTVARKVL